MTKEVTPLELSLIDAVVERVLIPIEEWIPGYCEAWEAKHGVDDLVQGVAGVVQQQTTEMIYTETCVAVLNHKKLKGISALELQSAMDLTISVATDRVLETADILICRWLHDQV